MKILGTGVKSEAFRKHFQAWEAGAHLAAAAEALTAASRVYNDGDEVVILLNRSIIWGLLREVDDGLVFLGPTVLAGATQTVTAVVVPVSSSTSGLEVSRLLVAEPLHALVEWVQGAHQPNLVRPPP